MKEKYEKSFLIITRFSNEDVITTSDRNNAYMDLTDLDDQGGKDTVPTR